MEKLSGNFELDVSRLDGILKVKENFDIIKRETIFGNVRQVFYYIDGFVKAESMQKLMMHFSTVKDFGDKSEGAASRFSASSVPAVEVDVQNVIDSLVFSVLSGCTVFLCEGFDANALVIDLRTYPARETSEPENDKVMRGSRDGFVETMLFNTAMLRRRIRDPRLAVEYASAGKSSRTDLALCYIRGRADEKLVKKLREKLSALKTDSVVLGHRSLIESIIGKGWLNPFPKIRITERPDVAAASVLEGSVILVCDNSPEVLLFPTSIFDFLQEADDYYFPPLTGTYLRIIRHFVFWLSVVATPLWYLALKNEAVLPPWLDFLIPRDPGQLPIIVQLFLTEFALDGLKLASLNTPDTLSNSLSVVGGLLLGDFAVQVGWLSPDVILYMSFVAIANFTQSSYVLGYAFKYLRMLTLLLTALFGIWGFIAGILVGLVLIVTNNTFGGKSYLYPLIPFNAKAMGRLLFRPAKFD
ncbi:MAG: spore germination protein [Ruminococcaceae bacterium]|nr:spore germination protein [Oscillospiraceae bacterium]